MNLDQRTGIFAVSEEIERYTGLKKWRNRLKRNPMPVVVAGEKYCRNGLQEKLHCSERITNQRLPAAGLFRPVGGYGFNGTYTAVDTLSIAQVVSWVFQTPIEEVLFSTNGECREKPIGERLDILFHAYAGSNWLDSFVKKHRRAAVTPPPVHVTHNISRRDAQKWFLASSTHIGSIRKFFDEGFVSPLNGGFRVEGNAHNWVNAYELAHLVARVYDIAVEDVMKEDTDEELVDYFLTRKLVPYIQNKGIVPEHLYGTYNAARLIGVSPNSFRSAVVRNNVPSVKRKGKYLISGIDLAIYGLKQGKPAYTKAEIADLFGVDDFGSLGMKISENGNISAIHYVYPIYDRIAAQAKERLHRGMVFSFDEGIVYLPPAGQTKYCEAYGIQVFDVDCIGHLQGELGRGWRVNGHIHTPQLELKIKDNAITSVRFNIRNIISN